MSSPISRVEASPRPGWPSYPSFSQGEFEERLLRRISTELHNGPAQLISLALLQLDALTPAAPGRAGASTDRTQRAVGTIRASLQQAMQEIRAMSVELAPGLDKLSLSQVIRSAVSHHERRTGATLAVKLHTLPEDGQLDLKNSVYRFVEDGLRLVSLNAKGALHEMEAACEGGLLCLEVMVGGQATNVEGLLDLQHTESTG